MLACLCRGPQLFVRRARDFWSLPLQKSLSLYKPKECPTRRDLGYTSAKSPRASSVLLAELLPLDGCTLLILFGVMFVTCSKLEAFHMCNGNIFRTVSWIFSYLTGQVPEKLFMYHVEKRAGEKDAQPSCRVFSVSKPGTSARWKSRPGGIPGR